MWAVWQKGHEGVVCILTLWKLCDFCGIVCGLPMASQHFVGMGVLKAQDGAVVRVVRLLPSKEGWT